MVICSVSTTGLRFFTENIREDQDMALFFLQKPYEGKPINIFNNGEMSRDFTYIDDIQLREDTDE